MKMIRREQLDGAWMKEGMQTSGSAVPFSSSVSSCIGSRLKAKTGSSTCTGGEDKGHGRAGSRVKEELKELWATDGGTVCWSSNTSLQHGAMLWTNSCISTKVYNTLQLTVLEFGQQTLSYIAQVNRHL